MDNKLKICFDKILPGELNRPKPGTFIHSFNEAHSIAGAHPTRMALDKKKLWINGSTLKVKFMEGTSERQDMVKQFCV